MSNVSADGRIYLTLDECYIEGVYSAVYMNGSTSPAEITINNSTIVSKDVGIYVSNSVNTGNRQKLTITDSTVTGTTAIEVKHTDATITGCTLISTAAEQKSQINGNGSCTEGFAFAVAGNNASDKTTARLLCRAASSTTASRPQPTPKKMDSISFSQRRKARLSRGGRRGGGRNCRLRRIRGARFKRMVRYL